MRLSFWTSSPPCCNHISDSTRGHESEDDFANLFEDLDLTSSKLGKGEKDKNNLVVKVLRKLATSGLRADNPAHDVLGDAYEYLIAQFASGAGKKAGEFYTPQEVSTVLARIVDHGQETAEDRVRPHLWQRIAAAAREAGSAGMWATIYGQEMNPTTFNLCRMNMIMHDVHYRQFDVRTRTRWNARSTWSTASRPSWPTRPSARSGTRAPPKARTTVCSAPGKLAPKTKADFAFLLHMLHHLETMAERWPACCPMACSSEGWGRRRTSANT
jgi:type I restriction enzyme M protein